MERRECLLCVEMLCDVTVGGCEWLEVWWLWAYIFGVAMFVGCVFWETGFQSPRIHVNMSWSQVAHAEKELARDSSQGGIQGADVKEMFEK